MSAQKRQLEKNRKERAAAKRERRQARPSEDATAEPSDPPLSDEDQDALLQQFAELHEQFGASAISLDEFAQRRDDLAARLRTD